MCLFIQPINPYSYTDNRANAVVNFSINLSEQISSNTFKVNIVRTDAEEPWGTTYLFNLISLY